jgi:Cys-tRNA(Pro)/Cys-tRNA(Cys) deacylase
MKRQADGIVEETGLHPYIGGMKTNALRILEAKHIPHEFVTYACDDDAIDAVSVADTLGVEREQVFKTLVARGDRSGIVVFCIPGPLELHLKKSAAVSGNKSIELVRAKEVLPLTGYIRGGCSPVGMKKLYPTFLDETALLYSGIFISAGARGIQMLLSATDLAALLDAQFADVT